MATASGYFSVIGNELYGEDWCAPVAQALGVNLRTMQRIKTAAREGYEYAAAITLLEPLRTYLDNRSYKMRQMVELIDQFHQPPPEPAHARSLGHSSHREGECD